MWKREIAGKACMGVLIKAYDWNLLSLHYSLLIDVHDLNFPKKWKSKNTCIMSRQIERVEMIWILGPLIPYDNPYPRLIFLCTPLISLQYPIFL